MQINDRKVMVTGAGGSIGSEICRQIKPAPILFDHSEFGLYTVWHETGGMPVLGDCKDAVHVHRLITHFNADVIHAAAYKHVPMLENDNAFVAVRNNIIGTLNTVRACKGRYVLISTDKAVNPTSVMGWSKRICELIAREYSASVVRFGNVLGSNGSVIPLFESQLKSGGPITVTHPEVSRYFMSLPQAIKLVLEVYVINRPGIYILEMGEPKRIIDLALNIIGDREIPIEFIGLRPGEKLHEELAYVDEKPVKVTANITRLDHATLPVSYEAERWLARPFANYEETRDWLQSLAKYGHGPLPVSPALLAPVAWRRGS